MVGVHPVRVRTPRAVVTLLEQPPRIRARTVAGIQHPQPRLPQSHHHTDHLPVDRQVLRLPGAHDRCRILQLFLGIALHLGGAVNDDGNRRAAVSHSRFRGRQQQEHGKNQAQQQHRGDDDGAGAEHLGRLHGFRLTGPRPQRRLTIGQAAQKGNTFAILPSYLWCRLRAAASRYGPAACRAPLCDYWSRTCLPLESNDTRL